MSWKRSDTSRTHAVSCGTVVVSVAKGYCHSFKQNGYFMYLHCQTRCTWAMLLLNIIKGMSDGGEGWSKERQKAISSIDSQPQRQLFSFEHSIKWLFKWPWLILLKENLSRWVIQTFIISSIGNWKKKKKKKGLPCNVPFCFLQNEGHWNSYLY